MTRPKPIVLIILDGWGYRAEREANAIALARKPTYDRMLQKYPNTLIHTSGRYVGLPEGQMGNSEVGHLNMGAGRIVHMDITRIDLMIQNGDFFTNAPTDGTPCPRGALDTLSNSIRKCGSTTAGKLRASAAAIMQWTGTGGGSES